MKKQGSSDFILAWMRHNDVAWLLLPALLLADGK